jgi:signal transduction histidine kinase
VGTLLFAATALEHPDIRANSARVEKIVATIKTNSERLAWLVENLLRVTRLGDDVDAANEQTIDVATVAGEVARQLAEMAARRNVRIVIDPQPSEVRLDPARLELALMNLVSNAIKYSDPEKPDSFVEVSSSVREGSETQCVIRVRDNGLGIADGNRDVIFHRFFRAHTHMDAELGVSGVGLGLAITADCVQAMGGTIECDSAVGKGTCFSITLPLKPPRTAEQSPSKGET